MSTWESWLIQGFILVTDYGTFQIDDPDNYGEEIDSLDSFIKIKKQKHSFTFDIVELE